MLYHPIDVPTPVAFADERRLMKVALKNEQRSPSVLRRIGRWLGRLLPVVAIVFIFMTTRLDVVVAQLEQADGIVVIAACALFGLVFLAIDTASYFLLFRRSGFPVSIGRTWIYKSVGTVINVFNYHLAGGIMAYQLRREHDISWSRGASLVLWMMVVDTAALAVLLLPGLVIPGLRWSGLTWWIAFAFCAGVTLLLGLMHGTRSYFPRIPIVRDLWRRGLLSAIEEANLGTYLCVGAARVVFRASFIPFHFMVLSMFGVAAPLAVVAREVPLLMLVAAIPFSHIGGLGVPQIAMRVSYEDYATLGAAQVDAFAITSSFLLTFTQLLVGATVYFFYFSGRRTVPDSPDEEPTSPS